MLKRLLYSVLPVALSAVAAFPALAMADPFETVPQVNDSSNLFLPIILVITRRRKRH